jgi:pyruvate-formate lyase
MSKAKEKVKAAKAAFEDRHIRTVSHIKHLTYIAFDELKEQNEEMLDCLLDCYIDMKNDCSSCSDCVNHYAIWQFIERKVEKLTGKPISEVLKDE